MHAREFVILVVEDNPADARLTQEAFGQCDLQVQVVHVTDGQEALAYLRREPPFAHAPVPHLILLDLKLPRLSGHQVLETLKSDPVLRRIPVVVMSSSDDRSDVLQAYDLAANCYVCKPIDLDAYLQTVQTIGEFWLKTARLPADG